MNIVFIEKRSNIRIITPPLREVLPPIRSKDVNLPSSLKDQYVIGSPLLYDYLEFSIFSSKIGNTLRFGTYFR